MKIISRLGTTTALGTELMGYSSIRKVENSCAKHFFSNAFDNLYPFLIHFSEKQAWITLRVESFPMEKLISHRCLLLTRIVD